MSNSPVLLRDLPQIQKHLKELEQIKAVRKAWPLIKLLFNNKGEGKINDIDIENIDKLIEDAEKIINELQTLPDKFNDYFSKSGWIVYDFLSIDTIRNAITEYENGNKQYAEQIIIDLYTYDYVSLHLNRMHSIKAFKPRMPLAKLCLEDYKQGRYYSCIPIILSLIDGLVNDITNHRFNFFAAQSDLTAWDSLVGHSKGLPILSKLMAATRNKTNTESISIPYRNGILHGIELGYANKIVAAKTWAALFAVSEWARIIEQGKHVPPSPPEKVGFIDSIKAIYNQVNNNIDIKKHLEQWEKRSIEIGVDIPESGDLEDYQENSPERALVEFLRAWGESHYKKMSNYLDHEYKKRYGNGLPKMIRDHYKGKEFVSFCLIKIIDEAPAISEITIKIVYKDNEGNSLSLEKTIRMIYYDNEGTFTVRTRPGHWVILNYIIPN